MVARETLVRDGLRALGLPIDAAEVLVALERHLHERAVPLGFLGPREGDRLIERHILDSAALAPMIPRDDRCIDVGSGAGLPGLVLAALIRGPIAILEAEGRRARFIERVSADLGYLNVEVIQGRAEDLARTERLRESFGAAVARALAPPPVALELVQPFVRPGGITILAVGPTSTAHDEVDRAARAAAQLSSGPPELVELQVPGSDTPRWAMIVRKIGVIGPRYPRRTGVPSRRPLA